MSPDDLSFWALPMPISVRGGGSTIVRYATPTEKASAAADAHAPSDGAVLVPPTPLATVGGMETACAIAVHPVTSELYVTDRKTQQFFVFPPAGGDAASGKPWGSALQLNFPYLPSLEAEGGVLGGMVRLSGLIQPRRVGVCACVCVCVCACVCAWRRYHRAVRRHLTFHSLITTPRYQRCAQPLLLRRMVARHGSPTPATAVSSALPW